jgi:hypothetical protein
MSGLLRAAHTPACDRGEGLLGAPRVMLCGGYAAGGPFGFRVRSRRWTQAAAPPTGNRAGTRPARRQSFDFPGSRGRAELRSLAGRQTEPERTGHVRDRNANHQ